MSITSLISSPFFIYGEKIGKYSPKCGNAVLKIGKTLANFGNNELTVEFGDDDFTIKSTPKSAVPDHAPSEFYKSGSVYFKNYPIPIKIRPNEELDNHDIAKGDRYRVAMQTKVIEDAYSKDGMGLSMTDKILMGNAVLLASILMAIVYLMG